MIIDNEVTSKDVTEIDTGTNEPDPTTNGGSKGNDPNKSFVSQMTVSDLDAPALNESVGPLQVVTTDTSYTSAHHSPITESSTGDAIDDSFSSQKTNHSGHIQNYDRRLLLQSSDNRASDLKKPYEQSSINWNLKQYCNKEQSTHNWNKVNENSSNNNYVENNLDSNEEHRTRRRGNPPKRYEQRGYDQRDCRNRSHHNNNFNQRSSDVGYYGSRRQENNDCDKSWNNNNHRKSRHINENNGIRSDKKTFCKEVTDSDQNGRGRHRQQEVDSISNDEYSIDASKSSNRGKRSVESNDNLRNKSSNVARSVVDLTMNPAESTLCQQIMLQPVTESTAVTVNSQRLQEFMSCFQSFILQNGRSENNPQTPRTTPTVVAQNEEAEIVKKTTKNFFQNGANMLRL